MGPRYINCGPKWGQIKITPVSYWDTLNIMVWVSSPYSSNNANVSVRNLKSASTMHQKSNHAREQLTKGLCS